MSASYDDTLPTDKDKVRSILGITDDTSEATALRTDEHIEAVLAWQGSIDGAVRYIASSLASQFAQLPSSIRSGPDALVWAERVKHWQELAQQGSPTGTGGGLTFVDAVYSEAVTADEFSRPLEYQP